jgi:hypothetical protein
MSNAIRYNFIATTALDTGDLLDDFGALMTALGATDLAAYADDEDIRASLAAGAVTSRIVPASNFSAWFAPGVDLTRGVEVTMECVDLYAWSDHPTEVDVIGNPVRLQGALLRRMLNLIIAASPTNSLDMGAMAPLLMAAVMALDALTPIQSIKNGEITGYSLPSGWVFVAEPIESADRSYGVTTNG